MFTSSYYEFLFECVCAVVKEKRSHSAKKLFCQSGIEGYYICNVFSHLDKNSFNQPVVMNQ